MDLFSLSSLLEEAPPIRFNFVSIADIEDALVKSSSRYEELRIAHLHPPASVLDASKPSRFRHFQRPDKAAMAEILKVSSQVRYLSIILDELRRSQGATLEKLFPSKRPLSYLRSEIPNIPIFTFMMDDFI